MTQHTDGGYSDIRDLIVDSLEILAQRRAKYLGDDLAAIQLLADLVIEAESALDSRVTQARAHGHGWERIAEALDTTVTEVRLRYDQVTSAALRRR